ncbi:MAG: NUDIX hydrolase [Lachnospiraceae bacterium]|nr:NUDIX hydrolase [Lachnospiraceae bacterium]
MSYEVLESNLMYKGKVLEVYSDKVVMPNGNVATRETVVRGSAAAIVPVDKDGNIIFVRQYRHAIKGMALEIPAGMLEEGEDPAISAKRELEEETGWIANNLTYVTKLVMSIGVCTETLYIYIAKDLTEGVMNPDPDEFIEIETYSLEDSLKMIYSGEIIDGKTAAALLAYKDLSGK